MIWCSKRTGFAQTTAAGSRMAFARARISFLKHGTRTARDFSSAVHKASRTDSGKEEAADIFRQNGPSSLDAAQKWMKAQVETAPGHWEGMEMPIPALEGDEVLLKLRVCAIGAGEQDPGHGFFGTVEALGPAVQNLEVGDRIAACVYPSPCFAQFVKVPASMCFRLSEELDDYTAAFVAPLAHVLQATRQVTAQLARPCVLRGAQMLRTALARARGFAPVISVVEGEARRRAALLMGADYAIDKNVCGDADAEIAKILAGREPEYQVSGDRLPERPESRSNWEDAVTLLTYKRVDPKPLYSVAMPLGDLQNAFEELDRPDGPVNVFVDTSLKVRFTFPGYQEPVSATIKP